METKMKPSNDNRIDKHSFGYRRTLEIPFAEAVEKTYEAVGERGFGVLFEVDLKQKFKEKLDADFGEYVILGACNPAIAHEAIQYEMDLGLLLPCNVVVYEDGSETVVAAVDAEAMLSIVGNPEMKPIAEKVNESLRTAVESI